MRKPLIFAHRGCELAPDGAFKVQGSRFNNNFDDVDFVELDVRKTADDVLVVKHDRSVKNTVRRVLVDKHSYNSLYQKTGKKLPKLDDVVEELRGRVGLNLDIKYPDVVGELGRFVRRHGIEREVIIDSPRHDEIEQLSLRLPRARFCYTFNYKDNRGWDGYKLARAGKYLAYFALYPLWPQIVKLLAKRKPFMPGASIYYRMACTSVVKFFHDRGIPVYVWPVSRESAMRKMVELGVDGIKTSKPELLKRILISNENNR